MELTQARFFQEFVRMADDGASMGWHERNGGNLSYRLTPQEAESIGEGLDFSGESREIGTEVPGLRGEYFLVTGSGKFFSRVRENPEENLALIQVEESGSAYRVLWGLKKGGRPTSELPTHLMNHEVKKNAGKDHRIIYHCHPVNLIALTFVLPMSDKAYTRELWETMTECPIIFPDGVGVVPWMVPGGREIALESREKMKDYDVVVWAHHGLFCSAADFDNAFALAHTVEKAAEILVKIRSMASARRYTIRPEDFRRLAREFQVKLPERFLED